MGWWHSFGIKSNGRWSLIPFFLAKALRVKLHPALPFLLWWSCYQYWKATDSRNDPQNLIRWRGNWHVDIFQCWVTSLSCTCCRWRLNKIHGLAFGHGKVRALVIWWVGYLQSRLGGELSVIIGGCTKESQFEQGLLLNWSAAVTFLFLYVLNEWNWFIWLSYCGSLVTEFVSRQDLILYKKKNRTDYDIYVLNE